MALVTRRAADVSQQRPQRADRGHQHSAGAAVRLRVLVPARPIGQPAVDRRGRFRHHRRFVGDHGREHLSGTSTPTTTPTCRSRTAFCGPRARFSGACCSRRPSWSARSCRCSRCRARKVRSSDRWPRPMPSPWPARCCWPSRCRPCCARCCCGTSSRRRRIFSCGICATGYVRQLKRYIKYRRLTLAGFAALVVVTIAILPLVGREFMPDAPDPIVADPDLQNREEQHPPDRSFRLGQDPPGQITGCVLTSRWS